MAQNFIESGERLDYTVGSGETITSGDVIIKGEIIGIALNDGVEGDVVTLLLEGVFELPKATGAITLGAKVYWVAADSNLSTSASGNTLVGVAWAAALSGDTTVNVRLKY